MENSKSPRAQTLIEVVVALGVILWIASLLILYSRTGEARTRIIRERSRLVLDLRRAQDFALGTREFVSGEIPCGYGIHFESNSTEYIIFADRASSPTSPCASANSRWNSSETVETVRLERGVKVLSTEASDIVFNPPEPKTNFYPPLAPGDRDAIIILALERDETIQAKVKVTTAGEISIVP